jgi:hypothetical protein
MALRDMSHLHKGPICVDCERGDHNACVDNYPAHDGLDVMPQMCWCTEGDCAPTVSYSCAEWMHNCGGCICWCHESEEARRMSRECHDRWSRSLEGGMAP